MKTASDKESEWQNSEGGEKGKKKWSSIPSEKLCHDKSNPLHQSPNEEYRRQPGQTDDHCQTRPLEPLRQRPLLTAFNDTPPTLFLPTMTDVVAPAAGTASAGTTEPFVSKWTDRYRGVSTGAILGHSCCRPPLLTM